ncbi:MAG: endonuclease/exonuclease/phosphatase family protein [Candidatus Sericytochromatia bacterium]
MKFLFQLGVLALAALSLGDRFGALHPLLDLLAHFKVQFALLLAVSLLPLLLLRSRFLLLLVLGVLGTNAVDLLPWYLPQAAPVRSAAPPLKLLLANVHFANTQVAPLQQLIATEQPDLVVLQEANDWHRQMMQQFKPQLPYHFRPPGPKSYGLSVWSRYPVSQPQFMLLGQDHLPSLSGRLHVNGQTYGLLTTQLSSPLRVTNGARNRQLDTLARYVDEHPDTALLLGDFNISMWSPYYKQLEKRTGLHNCRLGFGVMPSWPAKLPSWARIPIDQCLVSPALRVEQIRVGPSVGSDHLPLLITLSQPPRR